MNDAETSQRETDSELQRVRDYLTEHPSFFRDNLDVLEQLDVPHEGGGTSLLEYQVSVLRDKNQAMSRKLRDYHAAAEHNATLLEKIHGLYGLMLAANDRQQLAERISDRLRQEFGCNAVAIALFDADLFSGKGVVSLASQPALDAFASLRESPQAACGRFNRRKLELLFGERAEDIRSAALAPLDESGEVGLLALGSSDEHKFQPGMGTLFIELLARMLGESIAHRATDG
jgi:uncharacterized protein YigA (DUF484 family)